MSLPAPPLFTRRMSSRRELTPGHDEIKCSNFAVVRCSERFNSGQNGSNRGHWNLLTDIVESKVFRTQQKCHLFYESAARTTEPEVSQVDAGMGCTLGCRLAAECARMPPLTPTIAIANRLKTREPRVDSSPPEPAFNFALLTFGPLPKTATGPG